MSVYYNEFDPRLAAQLRQHIRAGHIASGDVDERSIEDVKPGDLRGYRQCHFFAGIGGWSYALRLAGWPDDKPVWTGSCPCQPFSAAGKGAGFEDERHLWPAWFHLIQQCRPAKVFGEQVEGPAARAWIDLVSSDLEGSHYTFGASVLPAACIGSPQLRHRTWFVADAYDARRKGAKRTWEQDSARTEWKTPRSELVRPDSGPWPPGPRAVHLIPLHPNGIPDPVGGCKGYGNAIVPQVAAEFILACEESRLAA